jgi:hypothetical protein
MKEIIEYLEKFTNKTELEKETLSKINLLVRGNKNINTNTNIPIDIFANLKPSIELIRGLSFNIKSIINKNNHYLSKIDYILDDIISELLSPIDIDKLSMLFLDLKNECYLLQNRENIFWLKISSYKFNIETVSFISCFIIIFLLIFFPYLC